MKIVRLEVAFGTKLCHARVGQALGLIVDGVLQQERYMLCEKPDQQKKRPARDKMTHGLYDSERAMVLVNVETGVMQAMPHLSSRVVIFEEAAFYEGPACMR